MRTKPRLTPEEIERIVSLRVTGMFLASIADYVNRDIKTVKKALRGRASVTDIREAASLTDEEMAQVRHLRESGLTRAEIVDEMGKSEWTIRKALSAIHWDVGPRVAAKPFERHEMSDDDFSFTVYQYVATHSGCKSHEVSKATGYSLPRVEEELRRLSKGEGRLLSRDGDGWRQWHDSERHALNPGNAWAFAKKREAA